MKNPLSLKRLLPLKSITLALLTALMLSSCYSVRIATVAGTPEPDPMNMSEGYYRGFRVHVIDTVVKMKFTDNELIRMVRCPEGVHTIEYRVTFGDVLRSGFTLGKRRKLRIKYVCVKESND
jgi:hypothetical protein